jgi:mono/diheme cytochrome c family protein
MILAVVLFAALLAAVFRGYKTDVVAKRLIPIYLLALILVLSLGYFGGKLVYGPRGAVSAIAATDYSENRVQKGKAAFDRMCSFCHFTDTTETKAGPGLKDLFNREALPVSNWPATEEGVRRQIRTPYDNMPPFTDLTDDEIAEIISYLKTL